MTDIILYREEDNGYNYAFGRHNFRGRRAINITQLIASASGSTSSSGAIPSLSSDPTDFSDPNAPTMWITPTGEVRYWDGAQVQSLAVVQPDPIPQWTSTEW